MKQSRRKYRLLHQLEEHMEVPMFILSIFWLYLFIVEMVKGLSPVQEVMLYTIWGIFIFEFLLKLLLASRKWHYLKKNWITIIALVIPAFRVVRIFTALRILRSARFLSSSNFVRALTSGKRFVSGVIEVQGPPPEPEMHVGMMLQFSNPEKRKDLQEFAARLCDDVKGELESATKLSWLFHETEPVRLRTDKSVRPASFLDDASQAMAQGPFDLVIVLTDRQVISRKGVSEPGLFSATARIIILSTPKLVAQQKQRTQLPLSSEPVRWNAALLMLHLVGMVMGLKPRRQSLVMRPFIFQPELRRLPGYTEREKELLQQRNKKLPERELKSGSTVETFIFHLLMSFRHLKQVIKPLLRNRAFVLPLSLPGLATAAIAPSIILIFTAEIWDVSLGMHNSTAAIFAIISIVGASFYLVRIQSLFLPRKDKKTITEHLAVANTVIYLSIFLAAVGLFCMVGGVMLLIEYYVMPADLMQTWPTLNKPEVTVADKIRLAAFISTIGVVTGALAGGLDNRTVIHNLALFDHSR